MKHLLRNTAAILITGLLFIAVPMLMLQMSVLLFLVALIIRLVYGPGAFRYYDLMRQARGRQAGGQDGEVN